MTDLFVKDKSGNWQRLGSVVGEIEIRKQLQGRISVGEGDEEGGRGIFYFFVPIDATDEEINAAAMEAALEHACVSYKEVPMKDYTK